MATCTVVMIRSMIENYDLILAIARWLNISETQYGLTKGTTRYM